MRLWRLCLADYAALDGEGARLWGGRWTPPGYRAIYAASTISLAVVERLVHTEPEHFGVDLVLVEIDVPGNLERTEVLDRTLPPSWRDTPAPESLQQIGQAWLLGGETAVLGGPSAVITQERNYLLNPAHRQFKRVRRVSKAPFAFDPRLADRPRRP